ncbi:MAG: hypothetical protein II794_06285 [Oscillospiraceae bacterium]|nr:hypothetical protein [Oscillospiraceae bacterium]
MKRSFRLLNILLPLAAGAAVYVFFRSDTYIALVVRALLPGMENVGTLPGTAFLRNYACDMLWAWALCFACSWVLDLPAAGALCAAALGALMELLQLRGLMGGTFDLWDIILEALSAFCASLIIYLKRGKSNEKYL